MILRDILGRTAGYLSDRFQEGGMIGILMVFSPGALGSVAVDPALVFLLDTPAPGFAHFFIMPMGERTMVSVRFYLYCDSGDGVVSGTERKWNDWLV